MPDRTGPPAPASEFLAGGGELGEAAQRDSEARLRQVNEALEAANAALAGESGRLKLLFNEAPSMMAVLRGPEHVFELANQAYLRLVGPRELLGKPAREALPEIEGQGFFELLDQLYQSGEAFVGRGVAVMLQRTPGAPLEQRFVDFIFQPITGADGRVNGIFVDGYDVTESRRAHDLQAAQRRALELALADAPLGEVLETLVRIIEQQSPSGMLGSVLLLDDDGVHLRHGAAPSLPRAYNEAIDGIEIGSKVGSCGTAAFTKAPVHVSDIDADPLWADFRGLARSHGLRACWSTPIVSGQDRVLGTFALYYPGPRAPTPADLELVEIATRSAALIIERKRAEARLRESEARFRAMADSAPAPVFMTSAAGALAFVNRAFEAFAGRSAEELMGDVWTTLLHPDDLAAVAERRRQAWIDHSAYQFEARFKGAGGAWLWMLVSAQPRLDGSGAFQGYVGMAVDLTERRRAEEALRVRGEEFQALADNIPTLCWMARADGHIFWYNRRWYEYTGTSPEDQEGWGWESVHDPQMLPSVVERWTRSINTGEPFEMTFPLKGGDGAYRPFLTRIVPIRDEHGQVVRWFGTNVDVSEQQRFAEDLERLVAQRTAERDRIWSTSSELMAVAGLDGYLKSVNPAWARVLGYDDAALLARPFTDLIHPHDLEASASAVEALARGEPLARFEDRLRGADGAWRWISWTATPGDGVFYAVGRDVTEEKQAAEELQSAEESLRQAQKMEAVGQLTGGIAHDFNNLLTAVVGGLDMIQRRAADERTKRIAANALQAAERGAKLTSQLLAFSRTQRLAVEPVPVNAAIERMRELLAGALGSTVELRFDLDPGAGAALTDANQLELAVLNLAINARDALGGRGKVAVSTAGERVAPDQAPAPGLAAGDYVVVSVADDGPGMSPEVLARAFDPFYTTKPVGQGTGLGLSQVYGIARQSGGAAVIDTEMGRGATVRIYLPVADGDAEEADAPPIQAAAARRGPRRAVLVVDDDPDVRRFIVDSLESLGFHVLQAEDGPSGLELFGRERPDLLLLDFAMPGMNGAEVAERARRVHPEQRVLFATGYADTGAIEQAAGDAAVLRKPFRLTDLAAAVEGALGV